MSATRPNTGAPRTLLDRVAARAAKVSTLPALPAASAAAAAAVSMANKQPGRRPEELLRMSPHDVAVMELSDTSVRVAPMRRRSLHSWLQGLAVALTFCDAPSLRALDSVSRAVGAIVRVQDCYQRLWRRTQEGRPIPQQHDATDVALSLRAAPHAPTPWKIILARYERELESGWTRYRTTHYQRVVVRYFAERVWGLPMFGMTQPGRSFFMESRYVYAGAVARRWGFEVVLQRQPRDDGEVIAALVRMRPALPQGQQLVCIIAFDALDRAMDVHAQGQPRRRTAYLVTFNITRDSNGAVFSRALLEPAAPDMVFDVEVFVVGPTEASFDEERLVEALQLPGTVVSDAMRTQLWNLCRNNSNGTVEGGPHSDPLVDDTTRRRKRLLRKFADPLVRDMGSSCADLAFASCAVMWNFTDVDYPALTPLQIRRAVRCVCKQLIALSEGAAAALRADFKDKCRAAADGAISEEAAAYQYPAPLALARSRDLVRYFTQTPTVIGALWNIATNESRTQLLFDPIDANPLAGLLVSLIERECVHSTYDRVPEGQTATHFPPPLSLVYAATHVLTRLQHFILAPRRARERRAMVAAATDAAAVAVDENAVMCERWGAVTSPTECVFRFSDAASTTAFPSAAEIAEDPPGARPFTSTFGDASLTGVGYDRIEGAITAAIGFLRHHTVAANDLGVALFGRDFVEFFLPLLRSRSDACVAFASFTFDVSYFPDAIRTPQESHVQEMPVQSPIL